MTILIGTILGAMGALIVAFLLKASAPRREHSRRHSAAITRAMKANMAQVRLEGFKHYA